MKDETLNGVFDSKDPNFLKNAVLYKLKDLCDKLEGADKCTICETIHILESPNDEKKDNSLWMMLLFFIIFGFGADPIPFDFETFSKILNNSETKTNEEEETK